MCEHTIHDSQAAAQARLSTRRHALRTALGVIAAGTVLGSGRTRASGAAKVDTNGTPAELVVLHTNDTHSRIEPFSGGPHKGKGGVARRAAYLRRERAKFGASLTLDAGDVFQGTPWFNAFHGSIDMQMLAAMGYDAMAIGNHDFDAGADRLAETLALAPDMAALTHYAVKGSVLEKRAKPWIIREFGALRVGVFGLGVVLDGLVNPKLAPHIAYSDPREAAARAVSHLRGAGSHVVIAVSHLGHTGYMGEPGDMDWTADVPGVDYVIGGHSHTFLDKPAVSRHASGWQTAVMQVGHSGLNVGRTVIRFNGKTATIARSRPVGLHASHPGRAIPC